MLLTGNKDVDFKILGELDDKDLIKMCNINKEAMQLCNNNQNFWLNRILIKFPYLKLDVLNKYKNDRLWSEYYINDLRKINNSTDVNQTHYWMDLEKVDWIMS